jgi:hypothetical protein
MSWGIKQIVGPKSDEVTFQEIGIVDASSVGIPSVALFPETAVGRAGVIIVLVLILRLLIADIA